MNIFPLLPVLIGLVLIGAAAIVDLTTRTRVRETTIDRMPIDKIDLEKLLSITDASTPHPDTGTWRNVWIRVATVDDTIEKADESFNQLDALLEKKKTEG